MSVFREFGRRKLKRKAAQADRRLWGGGSCQPLGMSAALCEYESECGRYSRSCFDV